MRVERYECDADGCTAKSNGDLDSWFGILCLGHDKGTHQVIAKRLQDVNEQASGGYKWKHACGEPCALKLVSQAMRELPR